MSTTTETRGAKPDWSARIRVLDDVDAHPGTTPGMIAIRTDIPRRAVTNHLTKLEQAGVIYRYPKLGAGVRIWPKEES
jgi:DNA-binding transcriptional ArsR family regulator